LESAFAKTFRDREFLASAKKSKLEITPIFGASIQRIVSEFLSMPSSIKERLKRVIKAVSLQSGGKA